MNLSKKSLKKLRSILLEITPEITAILDDFLEINKLRQAQPETTEDAAANRGIEVIKQFIDMLLVRRYEGIIKILAALYEISPKTLEEKELGQIVDMGLETLSDEALVRFFPQLGQLARKIPSAS